MPVNPTHCSYRSLVLQAMCHFFLLREFWCERNTVGPRLIGPIRTEDFSPLSQDNLKREVNHIKNYHLGPQNNDLY